jgi:uncharacterized protein YjbI with pentapeptide repeats
MSQLKPMIIVLLMLTSALAGCAGDDTTDLEQQIADLQQSNDEMEDTISQKNNEISMLQELYADSISNAETERSSLLEQLDELNSMKEEADNTNQNLNGDLLIQYNLVMEWIQRAVYYDFSFANMSNVVMNYADLNGADLTGANLSGSILSNSNLSYADLYLADLYLADLSNAKLFAANLFQANLSNADLFQANLRYADLTDTDLSNAYLYEADLYLADLYLADLSNANLTGADLEGAYLRYAVLTGADLTSVNWLGTTCPDGTNSNNNGNTCENNL